MLLIYLSNNTGVPSKIIALYKVIATLQKLDYLNLIINWIGSVI